MTRGLNKVQIIGNLGADPDLRSLPSGQAVAKFRIAVNRTRRDQQGNPSEETEWFRCVAFDRLAEIAGEYLHKGSRVYVEGRLQTRKYTDREGVERTTIEIVVNDLVLLDLRPEAGAVGLAANTRPEDDQDVPF
jgi:single-strand DNA-binding protein